MITGNALMRALRRAGFAPEWVNTGGGVFAVSVPVAGAVLTIGVAGEWGRDDMGKPLEYVAVVAEDAVTGDPIRVPSWRHDVSDPEYSWAECISVADVVREVGVFAAFAGGAA